MLIVRITRSLVKGFQPFCGYICDMFLSTYSGCVSSLGMESKFISDAQISASSQLNDDRAPAHARLHSQTVTDGKNGGWSACKNDLYQWFQVDLGSKVIVTRVATQGIDGLDEWVTKYRIQFSYSGINFRFYKKAEHSSAEVCPQRCILTMEPG